MHPAVHHYSVSDGLPQNQVYAIAQDPEGFLWVGTNAGGVARFDGHAWRSLGVRFGLPSASVNSLSVASDGTVFAGTSGGPARWNGSRWESLIRSPSGAMRPASIILALSGEEAWLGLDEGPELWRAGRADLIRIPVDERIRQRRVTSLAADSDGRILVGMDGGVGIIEPGKAPRLRTVVDLPLKAVVGVAWCGSEIAVAYEDGSCFLAGREISTPADFRSGIRALLPSKNSSHRFLLATENSGALEYDGGRWRVLGPWMGDADPPVFSMLEGREGILWIGTDRGLTKVVPSAFETLDANDGLPTDVPCYGMDEGADGSLWLAFWGFGVVCLKPDGSSRHYGREQGLEDLRVSDVLVDGQGALAVTLSGLWRIDEGGCRKLRTPPGLAKDLRTALRGPDGTLYLATFSNGLFRLRHGEASRLGTPLVRNINTLMMNSAGDLVVCGEGLGVVRLRGDRLVEHLTVEDGLPSSHVLSAFDDEDGSFWVATDRGVWVRRPGEKGVVLPLPGELDDRLVYWVVRGPGNAHFFGTNLGVLRLQQNGSWHLYGRKDGLGDNECNEGGVFVDSRGRLLVSTLGVSVFDGRLKSPEIRPRVFIDSVKLGKQEVPMTGKLSFRYSPAPLRLSFVCPSFLDERGTRFLYRMVGVSDNWSSSEPGQFSTVYAGLRPGSYTFEVSALTSDGRRSLNTARLPIRVLPEWWQSRIVHLFLLLAGLLLVLMLIRWRERRFARIQEKLEQAVADRTEELRQANERLKHLAVTDELTELPNRRSILETARSQFSYARRKGDALSVAMIDVDRFKEVNDSYGHEAGDGALRIVVKAMRRVLRTPDVLGRHGGDEFLLLLPGTDLEGGIQACGRIRESVEADTRKSDREEWRELSVSLGVTSLRDSDESVLELITRADEALYQAKAEGRNLVRGL